MTLYVSYTIDFIPDGSPAAAGMRPVRPIWMDVDERQLSTRSSTSAGQRGADGRFTYPDDAANPYSSGIHRNMWQVDRDGVLIATAGHVHTGGLSTDLWLRRTGARYHGPRLRQAADRERSGGAAGTAPRRCAATAPISSAPRPSTGSPPGRSPGTSA